METAGKRSRDIAKIVAFFHRAFILRPFRRPLVWGEDLDCRATNRLVTLRSPSQRLGFRMRLETLAIEYDLFVEDHAMNDKCPELQVRVYQLAPEFAAATAICQEINGASITSNILGRHRPGGFAPGWYGSPRWGWIAVTDLTTL